MSQLRETLAYTPVELSFGTSGLRDLVTDMTDLECYINSAGFLRFLAGLGQLEPGSKVFLAGDLRESTPRIARSVAQAVLDGGYRVVYCGLIPTPALANYALRQSVPGIMVTGSHIPADRNGIKFYRADGEVLKADEAAIKSAVAAVRVEIYEQDEAITAFGPDGMLKEAAELPQEELIARELYVERYAQVFDEQTFNGVTIVFYQHSAVGRDLLVELLERLGATVVPVGRSETFIPIDSENVTDKDEAYFRQVAAEHPGAFAIVSTDGDSDRPFVIDEHGEFHRGDMLGVVVAEWLEADAVAYPVSASDASEQQLEADGVTWVHTRIGSPYVIAAMEDAKTLGRMRVMGWEVNGGFLLGSEVVINDQTLLELPTRDAILPIIVALVSALQTGVPVSERFAQLPQRFTQQGLMDDFPVRLAQLIKQRMDADTPAVREQLGRYFSLQHGFGAVKSVNTLDGIRIFFDNGDIAHLRPSGNAPQMRIYSVAHSQERADAIVDLALARPGGIFEAMAQDFKTA